MYINKSLSFLEQAVIALADKRRDHIPFRQSKLTHVLKDSIGGACDTVSVRHLISATQLCMKQWKFVIMANFQRFFYHLSYQLILTLSLPD